MKTMYTIVNKRTGLYFSLIDQTLSWVNELDNASLYNTIKETQAAQVRTEQMLTSSIVEVKFHF